jgi:hypothetical protein
MPEKITVSTCNVEDEFEVIGYIREFDLDRKSFQVQREGTVSRSDRFKVEYHGDFDFTQEIEQDILAATNRGNIVHVSGNPYIKKDVTGHTMLKKLSLISLDINHDVSRLAV